MLETRTLSRYAVLLNETSNWWTSDNRYNRMFLAHVQNYCNERLKAQGRLYLNDVYEMLDIPKTNAGQVVGWIYNEENPIGDNYVSIDVYCIDGFEANYVLDFNVDGQIYY